VLKKTKGKELNTRRDLREQSSTLSKVGRIRKADEANCQCRVNTHKNVLAHQGIKYCLRLLQISYKQPRTAAVFVIAAALLAQRGLE
jgi:hypothetical protein